MSSSVVRNGFEGLLDWSVVLLMTGLGVEGDGKDGGLAGDQVRL